jgi:hypothetical protein
LSLNREYVVNTYQENTIQDEKVKTEKEFRHQVRARLLLKCGVSVSAFVRRHGYKPKTVDRVIGRYWSNGKTPKGPVSQIVPANRGGS